MWSGSPGLLRGAGDPVGIFQRYLALWHNVQNLDMMFSDYVGTPAVVGSSVALQLDSAQGERRTSLGSELITNGGFDADTNWTKGSGWTISGGVATRTATGGTSNVSQSIGAVFNTLYKVVISATISAGNLTVRMGNNSTVLATASVSGEHTFYVRPASTDGAIYLAGDSTFAGSIDNVSCREVITVTEQARGSELKASGTVGMTGTATAATYNTVTGAGTISRASGASNVSWVQWSGLESERPYVVVISNTGSVDLLVRGGNATGSIRLTLSAGQTRTLYALPSSGLITLTAANDSTTASFTITSFAPCLGTPRYQTTSAQRPILGRHPKGGRRNLLLATATLSTQSVTVRAVAHTLAFTGTGTVTLSGVSTAGPLVGTGASDRVTLTFTPTAGSLTLTVSGSVTIAQLEEGSAATNYQAVTTTYNCTETGVPDCYFLQADGSDDGMVTPAINLSATDKIAVFAGVRKLSDAASGVLVELTATTASNNGSFRHATPHNASGAYSFGSRGTTEVVLTSPTSYAAPNTALLTGIGNISGDSVRLRINGVELTPVTTDQGTGNFSNAILYYFRRGGTTYPVNGLEYGNFIVSTLPDAAQIAAGETYQNNYIGVY